MNVSPVASSLAAYAAARPIRIREKKSSRRGNKDTVNLSQEAKDLLTDIPEDEGVDPHGVDRGEDLVTLAEIRGFYHRNADQIRKQIKRELQAMGIGEAPYVSLESDAKGRIRVASDLRPRENKKLERRLNKNEVLTRAFSAANTTRGLMKAIENHLAFAKAYRRDPQAAVKEYASDLVPQGRVKFNTCKA